jgi:plasmid stabilization system protein ParE
MKLAYHARALEEIRHELRWYVRRDGPSAATLQVLIEETALAIARNPLAFPVVPERPRFRRAVLERFPFSLVFLVAGDTAVIIALAHARRRPRYWERRTAR